MFANDFLQNGNQNFKKNIFFDLFTNNLALLMRNLRARVGNKTIDKTNITIFNIMITI